MKHILFLLAFFIWLFWELLLKGFVAAPVDTLVGAYYPWVSYKWGYSTGVPVKNAVLSDVFDQFFIWKHYAAAQLFSGHIPTWNPYVFLGTPFLATFHSAVLHPANILFLLPIPVGWNLHIILSTVVATLGMYLFLKNHTNSPRSALLGSLVFALGGPMSTWSEFGTAVWGMAMLPLLLWSIDTGKFKFLPPFFLCLILAGNVQVTTYATAVVLLYAWVTQSFSKSIKTGLLLVLGLCMAGIQLLPTVQLYQHSIRSGEKYSSLFNYGLNNISQSIRFIAPDIFGHPSTNNFTSDYAYHDFTGFFGTAALILVLSTLIFYFKTKPSSRPTKFFIWTFLISLALSVDWPVSRFIFSQPIPLLTYSLASRIYFLSVFAAGFLISQSELLLVHKSFRIVVLVTSLLTIIYAASSYFHLSLTQQPIGLRNLLLPVCLALFVSGIAILWHLKKIRTALFCLLLLACAFDLGRYYRKYNPFVPSRLIFPPTQTTDFLKNHTDYAFVSLSSDVLPPNSWMWYGIRSFEGYDPLYLLSFNRYFQLANGQTIAGTPGRFVDITSPNLDKLRLANVGYYAIKNTDPVPIQIAKFPIAFAGEGIVIYQDHEAMPFRYQLKPDEGTVATNYDSGWQARFNGQRLATFPIDGTLLGIKLPDSASVTDIDISYKPLSLLLGAVVSAVSIPIYIYYVCVLSPKRRQT